MSDLKSILEARRSINFFDPNRPIPAKTLADIVNLAVLAPSAFNLQPWRLIAVSSKEAKEKLFPLTNRQDKILEAPVTFIVIGNRSGFEPTNPAWQELADMLNDVERVKGMQSFARNLYGSTEERRIKFAESNAGLLAMSILAAAKYYGVDSHAMSGIDFAGIKAEFGLKDEEEVVMLIGLGYFRNDNILYPRRKRLGYHDIVEEV